MSWSRVEGHTVSRFIAYTAVIVLSALAAASTLLFGHQPDFPSTILLLLPVAVASWYGGRAPGFAAMLVGGIVGAYTYRVISSPAHTLIVGLRLVAYVSVGSTIVWLTGALSETRRHLQTILRASPVPVFAVDTTGKVTWWTPAAERMLGWSEPEIIGKPLPAVPSDKMAEHQQLLARTARGEMLADVEVQRRTKNGTTIEVSLSTAPIYTNGGRLMGSMAVYTDITQRKRAEEALRAGEERYRVTFDQAAVGIAHVDPDGHWLRVNDGICRMLGNSREELLGTRFQDVTHPDDLTRNLALFQELMTGKVESYTINKRFTRKDGSCLWAAVSTALARDAAGQPAYTISVIEDISERERAEQLLRHQALHDALTELPNRSLLQDRLEQAVPAARRAGSPFALLLLDLDRFKEINDTFGHHVGDELLRHVGLRLQKALRQSDTVARLGGDEFALLLPNNNAAGAGAAARKVLRALDRPFSVGGHRLEVHASIGVALYPDHGDEATALLQHADVAMYRAKRQNSGYALYVPAEDIHTPNRLALATALHAAVRGRRLHFHYQPQLDLRTNRIERVEVLARWTDPEHGVVPPDEFIPLAEQSGLIKPLTIAALNAALDQCLRWRDSGMELRVAVNVSTNLLHDPDLPRLIRGALRRHALPAGCLEVEITEGAMMLEPQRAMQALGRLHAMGVKIGLDDFGTGFSSLGYLKRLPVDVIKIDRSFVGDMAISGDAGTIVRATINLAHDLGLEVVAEGVEDRQTCGVLHEMGCDLVQGYYLNRPLPGPELTDWLRERERATVEQSTRTVPRFTLVKRQTDRGA